MIMIALFRCGEPGPTAMAAGGVLYVLGMFVVDLQRAPEQRAI